MWPSVPAFRSYGNIACPSGASCRLPYCIFSHDAPKTQPARSPPSARVSDAEPAAKRLKLGDGVDEPAPKSTVAQSPTAPKSVFVGFIVPKGETAKAKTNTNNTNTTSSGTTSNRQPAGAPQPSGARPVPAPPKPAVEKAARQPDAPVSLMPRKLIKDPNTFTKRLTLLKALHSYMKPLNDKIAKAVKPEIKALHLSPNELNKLAVDEEEAIAKNNSSVYENVLKQRLVRLKGMTPEEWVKGRIAALAKERGDPPKKAPPKKVDTGLTPKEEICVLSNLVCSQDGLDKHGYVTKLPTQAELDEAEATQKAAGSWEMCDRCSTRFQVFPERREEDGALTTGGQCTHHWGKRIFPKKSKNSLPEPARFSCCNEPMGSPGCTTHDTHVYKISDVKRLSLVMPFIETPVNDNAPPDSAVCFDCEMGYTTHGLELLRLTVISWPNHKPLVDVLVRPLGHLLDINTRFSGVTAEQFVNAKPYDPLNPKPVRTDIRIVDSPYAARDLFLKHVTTTTPVLGHALENDLNTIRIVHPTIIDTILLYPHQRGLPLRHGLRFLAKEKLDIDIQQGGAAGHDSFEDARTTGELVRFRVSEKWKAMKDDGWEIRDGGVFPPMPPEAPPPTKSSHAAPPAPSMVPTPTTSGLEGKPAEKRKLDNGEEGMDGSQEPPVKKQA
jgi:RNA exonuclease 1